jgi:1-acyl-sn-glycerol-3-phosphate acyltransferase
VGVRISVSNLDVLRELDRPVVFVANHMSTLETMVLPCLIQPFKDTTFITKESLLRFPVFGPVLQARQPVVVGRQDPREDLRAVLEGGKERLAGGRSIIVFPQTTRSQVFDPARFNTIGIKLASRASVPVIPIALQTDAWGPGSRIKDFGPIDPDRPVRFAFGEPLTVRGNGREEHEQVIRFIQGKLEEWKTEIPD